MVGIDNIIEMGLRLREVRWDERVVGWRGMRVEGCFFVEGYGCFMGGGVVVVF